MIDFPLAEFEARLARAQALMRCQKLDALLVCTEAELRYFSGFRTLFWQSPARPWFLILPRNGPPKAVIPAIGAALMNKTWVQDIEVWNSPNPEDEGVSLLQNALRGMGRVGVPMGPETCLRMPLADFEFLRSCGSEFIDCTDLIKTLRMVKSPAEIAIISQIISIAGTAFARAPTLFHEGQTIKEAFRDFKIALLQEGADEVQYLVGGAGSGGYSDVISPPDEARLSAGDVLMLDTGSTLQGYFCDYDRNFAIGKADDLVKAAYQKLWNSTEVGLAAAQPGISCSEVFTKMHDTLGGSQSGVGRFGHGLGMQLTEWPSIRAGDDTVLQPGMVMTLEPSIEITPGKMMVHEENILITEDRPIVLSPRAPEELPII